MAQSKDEMSKYIRIRLLLKTNSVSGLIGEGGKSINKIRQQSGANIFIADNKTRIYEQNTVDPKFQICFVNGNLSETIKSTQLIVDKIAIEMMRTELQYHIILLINENDIGCLLGEYGNGMADICNQTNANVYFQRQILTDSSEKAVVIEGERECVHSAINMIINRLLCCGEMADDCDKDRYVLVCFTGGQNAKELTESDVSCFVGGSITRIIKRQTYKFFIEFENAKSALDSLKKLGGISCFGSYRLTVQMIDAKVWQSLFT